MGNHLQHSLLMKFVDGLDGKAYDRICEEDESLTFERAYEIAVKYEPDSIKVAGIFQIDQNKQGANRRQTTGNRGQPMGRCLACNRQGHYKRDCRFKEYVCKKCNKRGHLQAACSYQRNFYVREQDEQQMEEAEDEVTLQQNFINFSI
ncbi:uncharacterized protein LOC134216507 [Armigeres subalbatus]